MALDKSFVVPNGLAVNSTAKLYGDLVISGGLYIHPDQLDNWRNSLEIYSKSYIDEQLSITNYAYDSLVSSHFETASISGASDTSYRTVSSVPISGAEKVVWELLAVDETNNSNRYSSTIAAMHDGITGVNWNEYGIMYTGTQNNLGTRVTNDGTYIYLQVSSPINWIINASKNIVVARVGQ